MPKFMDVHNMPGVTKAAVAEAHKKDLAVQGKHGVKFMTYWVDEAKGKVFRLSEAPTMEAAKAAHKEAGHPTNEVYAVHEGH
jgi:heme-degrading monooxygenase HmoA